jgi:hypothetical protein
MSWRFCPTQARRTKIMTNEDALALVFMSLNALTHRQTCLSERAAAELPVRIIQEAMARLEEAGTDTVYLREMFLIRGLDLSSPVHSEGATPGRSQGQHAAGSQSRQQPNAECNQDKAEMMGPQGESSRSRIPPVVEEAIRAKFQYGWSKSRIAREFRLNRRTVIRICAGKRLASEGSLGAPAHLDPLQTAN